MAYHNSSVAPTSAKAGAGATGVVPPESFVARARALIRSWPAWFAPAGVGVLAAAGLVFVGAIDPNTPGHFPTCPLLEFTGTYCVGCGTLRALHALVHLDFSGFIHMNPALAAVIPYVALSWASWLRRTITGRPRTWLAPAWVIRAVLVLILAYWVIRNVPALAPWLAPGGVVAPAFA